MMGGHQLPQRLLGPRAQLGNHLAGTEGAEFTAAGQILPLGIGV